jgi:hypothetical protein
LNDRHEKGVLNDHQRAIAKMGSYKKKRMTATVNSAPEVRPYFLFTNSLLQKLLKKIKVSQF